VNYYNVKHEIIYEQLFQLTQQVLHILRGFIFNLFKLVLSN